MKRLRTITGTQSTPVHKRPSLDFSLTGLVYSTMMMFMGMAAVNTQANLLFGVFGLLVGVLLVTWMLCRVVLRRIEVNRLLPETAIVGKPVTLQYQFTNLKRFWPSLSVTLSEIDAAQAFTKQPVAYMLHAAPRMTATVPTEAVPKRRGLHAFDKFQLSTSFPFGFIKRATDRTRRETMLIFPAIAQVDPKLLLLCRSADRTGATMRPRRGGDDEFYGIKEYRAGENPRHIYWRRSARTGVLVTREMTQVSPPKLLVMVDTFIKEDPVQEQPIVERVIAMAASVASHALEAGLMVGLFAWADGWLSVHPNRGKRHRRDLLTQLAQLPQNTQRDTRALLDAGREFSRAGATPMLLTPRNMQMGLLEQSRSNLVVVSAASPQAQQWFTFDPQVDFAACAPWNELEKRDSASERTEAAVQKK